MIKQIKKLFGKPYPQNFVVRRPVYGALLFVFLLFLFLIMYRPLDVKETHYFNFVVSMFIYQLILSVPVMILTFILNRTHCFSKNKSWTFSKELKSDITILLGAGISVYFLGFLMEEPANRWNLPTFFDAVYRVVLIGIIPLGIFTLSNIRHLYVNEVIQEFNPEDQSTLPQPKEELLHIISQLKKEELNFFPREFIFAESEGNYVVFHLNDSEKLKKVMIRNSISNIEKQLSGIPYFVRTHRAFIVNVKKVVSKKGNSLGYRLKFSGIEPEIPVSRQNIQAFDELIRQFR